MKILNLTRRAATEDQKKDGLFDSDHMFAEAIRKELLIKSLPTEAMLYQKARQITDYVKSLKNIEDFEGVMLGGINMLIPYLHDLLSEYTKIFYPYSEKVNGVHTHVAFIEVGE